MSGWSAPSTRSRSARACSYSGMARPRSPAVPVGAGEVVPRAQGVGVVGAQHPLAVGQGLLVQRDGPAQVPRRPGRRRRGCSARSGCRGGRRPAPAPGRPGPARTAGWPGPGPPRPGRRRRGCSARSGCRGGRRPAPARGRPGPARTAGWPGPGPPRPGRRRRGCSARPGCRGGRRRAPARRSARTCSNSGMARPRSPVSQIGAGEDVPRGQGCGWSAPSTRPQSARARWRYPAARPGWPWPSRNSPAWLRR